MGSPPVFQDWRTFNSFIKEDMVLSLLLCFGRGQDFCMSSTGSISDICQDKVEWKKTLVRLKWKMLEIVQMESSIIAPAFLSLTPSSL